MTTHAWPHIEDAVRRMGAEVHGSIDSDYGNDAIVDLSHGGKRYLARIPVFSGTMARLAQLKQVIDGR